MELDTAHILSLAPDPASAAAGRKLAGGGAWQALGRDADALWGECRGSALYQVRVDARDFAAKCGCPSRKFPCKHSLGLLLLAAAMPAAVPAAERPEWVTSWLASRAAGVEAKLARPAESNDPAKARRVEKRLALVRQGIDGLDLWLRDSIRNGLAGVELRGASFWEKQAARLIDCQAPGLAQRVRRLAAIPGSSPTWPDDLLAALGSLALLTEAFDRLETLPPELQTDVKGLIGWTLKEAEVITHGDLVDDRWLVCGQWIEDEDRLRTQRTWLRGEQSGRAALVLQFSVAGSSFGAPLAPGNSLRANLAFWPGSVPLRAFVAQRHESPRPMRGRLPGCATIEEFLGGVSAAVALQPWIDRLPCLLCDVIPAPSSDGPWQVIDTAGHALPLTRGDHWLLLAVSGGRPIDIAGEWQGGALLPLGICTGAGYVSCATVS